MYQFCCRVYRTAKRHATVIILMLCIASAAFAGGWFARDYQARRETIHYLSIYTATAHGRLWSHYQHMNAVGVQDKLTYFTVKNSASIANTLLGAVRQIGNREMQE